MKIICATACLFGLMVIGSVYALPYTVNDAGVIAEGFAPENDLNMPGVVRQTRASAQPSKDLEGAESGFVYPYYGYPYYYPHYKPVIYVGK